MLDKWARDVAKHASYVLRLLRCDGEMGGRFMIDQLNALPTENDASLATWLVDIAKSCYVGLSGLDKPVKQRLEKGRTVSDLKRTGLAPVQAALDELVGRPLVRAAAGLR